MTAGQPPTAQLYAMILENVEDAVIAIDQAGCISLLNPAAQTFTGLSEKQCLGRRFSERFQRQTTLCYLARIALEEGRSISDHETVELRMAGRRPRPVSVNVSPIFTSDGQQQGAVMILRDLSQVRNLEEAVRRADRLSMVGTMAAGLAHEIKNPLVGIKGAAQLLQMELEENSELAEYPQVMIREAERVNRIIEELLDLSRPREPRLELVNIGQVLNEIVLLQRQSQQEKGVRFKLQLDPSIPPTHADRDLLVRLFLNLIKNAGEAAPAGGEVTIESRIDSEYHLSKPGTKPVPMLLVTVSDNGPGIPQDARERIFTPFYTTKTAGSGLGLATCLKIVNDHSGLLKISDRPGGGTAVRVSLPLVRQLPATIAPVPPKED